MPEVYLSIGANLGDKVGQLRTAIAELAAKPEIDILATSKFYQTAPVGGVPQDDFINAAVRLETALTPSALLEVLHQIEQGLHRVRKIHWGPRTIDLDIIFYDHETVQTTVLTIPHPETFNRRFVLVPLLDILPPTDPYYAQVKAAQTQLGDTQALQVFNGV
ncbi:2-amino-4-hydroxy-6-hydroxymethyldihydropteridine diphosphokinase [Agrilactobacillus fermenti]|uniref:2-amino-4-hydroxy-6- hydroxymethyldihydropteridine diphosphokinase n=1 Tax=Agrilactobacillus fermenti TaxID=2586909 RepID=UPI003A5BE7CA